MTFIKDAAVSFFWSNSNASKKIEEKVEYLGHKLTYVTTIGVVATVALAALSLLAVAKLNIAGVLIGGTATATVGYFSGNGLRVARNIVALSKDKTKMREIAREQSAPKLKEALQEGTKGFGWALDCVISRIQAFLQDKSE